MDSFFGIGLMELVVIAVITLLVMGPERMPGMMREGAKYIRMIRGLSKELTDQFRDELDLLDEMNPKRIFDEATDPNYEKKQAAKKANKAKASTAKSVTKKSTSTKPTTKSSIKKTEKPALGSEPVVDDAASAKPAANGTAIEPSSVNATSDATMQDDAVENSIASPEMLAETEEAQPVAVHMNGTASVVENDHARGENLDQNDDEQG